jgi:hypothetical protein
MPQSLADLQAELTAAEAQLVVETDPTQVAVLAGRIIELKNEVAAAAPLPSFLTPKTTPAPVAPAAPAQAVPETAPAAKATLDGQTAATSKPMNPPASDPTQVTRDAQIAQATRDAQAAQAAQVDQNLQPTLPAQDAQPASAPAPTPKPRRGFDPVALRPTRN